MTMAGVPQTDASELLQIVSVVALPLVAFVTAFAVTWLVVGWRRPEPQASRGGALLGAAPFAVFLLALCAQVFGGAVVPRWVAIALVLGGLVAGAWVGVDARRVLGRRQSP